LDPTLNPDAELDPDPELDPSWDFFLIEWPALSDSHVFFFRYRSADEGSEPHGADAMETDANQDSVTGRDFTEYTTRNQRQTYLTVSLKWGALYVLEVPHRSSGLQFFGRNC